MENADKELLERILPENPRLHALYKAHLKLGQKIDHLENYEAYSPSTALQLKELKKEKLNGMDEIMTILAYHKAEESMPKVANA